MNENLFQIIIIIPKAIKTPGVIQLSKLTP